MWAIVNLNLVRKLFIAYFTPFALSSDCLLTNPAPAGYTVTGSTTVGATPTVTCASEYSGTPAALTCQADGSWDASFAGCDRGESLEGFEIYFFKISFDALSFTDIKIFI